MNTPLLEAIEAYQKRDTSRFHTPGHGGVGDAIFGKVLGYDVTEIPGLGSLYQAEGVLAQLEDQYTKRYGSYRSFVSAGGSTLCIQTMLSLVAGPGDTILVGRNAHTSVVNTLALLQVEPAWIYPAIETETALSLPITPEQVRRGLQENPSAVGVFVTSPDYYGRNADIQGISALCKAYKVPLLVDAAHGAHYPWVNMVHPNAQGADLCCNSLHKTLPTLTGAAVLHCNNVDYAARAKGRMALFGSTSPSYLILLSMDLLLGQEDPLSFEFPKVVEQVGMLKELAQKNGYIIPSGSTDPTRLTLGFGGGSPQEFTTKMRDLAIEPEYADDFNAIFIAGVNTTQRDWQRLHQLLEKPLQQAAASPPSLPWVQGKAAMPLWKAVFSPHKTVEIGMAEGKIAGEVVSPCPPGIPLVVPGELFTPQNIDVLGSRGFFTVNVVY